MKRPITILTVALAFLVSHPAIGDELDYEGSSSPVGSTVHVDLQPVGYSVYVGDDGCDGCTDGCSGCADGCATRGSSRGRNGSLFGSKACGCNGNAACGSCQNSWDSFCGDSCGGCGSCQADSFCRRWGGVEYLHVWTKGRALPPLVTEGTLPGFARLNGVDSATVVFGDHDIGQDLKSGARVVAGTWLDEYALVGVGVKLMGVEDDSTSFYASAPGTDNVVLARPYYDTNPALPPQENSFIVARMMDGLQPFTASGNVAVNASHDIYIGDAFARYMLKCEKGHRLDLVGGYLYSRFDDGIEIISNTTVGADVVTVADHFNTINELHAGGMGLLSEYEHGPVTVSMMGRVNVGDMRQKVNIRGFTNINNSPHPVTPDSGLFARSETNAGQYERQQIVVMPEVNFNMTYAVSNNLDISVGYTFMYWNNVVLAAEQIDRNVNGDQLADGVINAGPQDPSFSFVDSDYYIHAINIGLIGRF